MALLRVIIKCADVSNEVRPETVAKPWVKCLFEEYSQQCAREKMENLPVAPYMDPELVGIVYNSTSYATRKKCQILVVAGEKNILS